MDYSTLPRPLHFRFTHSSETDLTRLRHFVVGQFKPVRLITVQENADEQVTRDHTHTVIFVSLDKKKFSTMVRKTFPIHKGNSSFMVEDNILDPYALECYVCKGKSKGELPIVLETTLTQEEIEERHNAYWKKNEELLEGLAKKVKKTKKDSWTLTVAKKYMKERPGRVFKRDDETQWEVFNFILDNLGEDGKSFDFCILRKFVFGVLNIIIQDSAHKKAYRKFLYRQVFPEGYQTLEDYNLMA